MVSVSLGNGVGLAEAKFGNQGEPIRKMARRITGKEPP
jgi:hypothetical protein